MKSHFTPPSKKFQKGEKVDFEIYKNGSWEKAPAIMLTTNHEGAQCQLLNTNEVFYLSSARFSHPVNTKEEALFREEMSLRLMVTGGRIYKLLMGSTQPDYHLFRIKSENYSYFFRASSKVEITDEGEDCFKDSNPPVLGAVMSLVFNWFLADIDAKNIGSHYHTIDNRTIAQIVRLDPEESFGPEFFHDTLKDINKEIIYFFKLLGLSEIDPERLQKKISYLMSEMLSDDETFLSERFHLILTSILGKREIMIAFLRIRNMKKEDYHRIIDEMFPNEYATKIKEATELKQQAVIDTLEKLKRDDLEKIIKTPTYQYLFVERTKAHADKIYAEYKKLGILKANLTDEIDWDEDDAPEVPIFPFDKSLEFLDSSFPSVKNQYIEKLQTDNKPSKRKRLWIEDLGTSSSSFQSKESFSPETNINEEQTTEEIKLSILSIEELENDSLKQESSSMEGAEISKSSTSSTESSYSKNTDDDWSNIPLDTEETVEEILASLLPENNKTPKPK